ncbi:MAG: hypothetical protein AAB489_04125, partial [Patescibacteria group bacterium]
PAYAGAAGLLIVIDQLESLQDHDRDEHGRDHDNPSPTFIHENHEIVHRRFPSPLKPKMSSLRDTVRPIFEKEVKTDVGSGTVWKGTVKVDHNKLFSYLCQCSTVWLSSRGWTKPVVEHLRDP